jgi:SlyX protein
LDDSDPQPHDRLTALEELAAHQAHTIEELSFQLAEQWKVVDRLEYKLERLAERFKIGRAHV